MDRAIIIGAFGFLGFSVCQAMLDEGIEVNAISVSDEPDLLTEEKRMEIGRNANFFEDEKWIINGENEREKIPIIIPICDYYIQEKESLLFENPFLKEELVTLSPEYYSVTLLLPEQLIREDASNQQQLVRFQNRLNEKGFSLTEVLVPTLFGPWQPEVCYFQQMISLEGKRMETPTLNPRESLKDAVYITDAASVVMGLLDEAQPGKYMILSGKEDSWFTCLDVIYNSFFISKDIPDKGLGWLSDIQTMIKSSETLEEPRMVGDDYNRIYVQEPMDLLSGLEEQRKEYFRLLKEKLD